MSGVLFFQLFIADAKILKKKFFDFFCPQKVEKKTLKSCSEKLNFFPYCLGCQMAQTEEFMLENVAYRPTVYRTGLETVESSPSSKDQLKRPQF